MIKHDFFGEVFSDATSEEGIVVEKNTNIKSYSKAKIDDPNVSFVENDTLYQKETREAFKKFSFKFSDPTTHNRVTPDELMSKKQRRVLEKESKSHDVYLENSLNVDFVDSKVSKVNDFDKTKSDILDTPECEKPTEDKLKNKSSLIQTDISYKELNLLEEVVGKEAFREDNNIGLTPGVVIKEKKLTTKNKVASNALKDPKIDKKGLAEVTVPILPSLSRNPKTTNLRVTKYNAKTDIWNKVKDRTSKI
jgi:hypothetical protein